MILLGMKAGSRSVHVRIDDLEQSGREQVREAIRLIEQIAARFGLPEAAGGFGILMGAMAVCIGVVVRVLPDYSFANGLAVMAGFGVPIGIVSWLLVRWIMHDRQEDDVASLNQLLIASSHCRELMDECLDADPRFKKLLGDPQPVPGQV